MYVGGKANQPHIHYYGNSAHSQKFHIKIGQERFDIDRGLPPEQNWLQVKQAQFALQNMNAANGLQLQQELKALLSQFNPPLGLDADSSFAEVERFQADPHGLYREQLQNWVVDHRDSGAPSSDTPSYHVYMAHRSYF